MIAGAVAVTGAGIAIPDAGGVEDLLVADRPGVGGDPLARLPRRGLRYKDRSTRLALAAADDALHDAGLLDAATGRVVDGSTGVIVSSNFGNLDTVCSVAATIAAESVAMTSPMDLPNASSNVIASSVAIRYGLHGVNLTVCNGATSGLDAIDWALTVVAAGRANRMLVIGVESSNPVVAHFTGRDRAELFDGAIALVLERSDATQAKDAATLAPIGSIAFGSIARGADAPGCIARLLECGDTPAVWFAPGELDGEAAPGELDGKDGRGELDEKTAARLAEVPRHALARFGSASGASGVLGCAAAVAWLRQHRCDTALVTARSQTGSTIGVLMHGGQR